MLNEQEFLTLFPRSTRYSVHQLPKILRPCHFPSCSPNVKLENQGRKIEPCSMKLFDSEKKT